MSYTRAVPLPAHGYRLQTFGTLALVGSEGHNILGKHGQQRRRLALLAVLAAAGERGRSRDHLLLLFWPDATEERARHSLDQLLYAIRNSLGEGVFAGANPVRLAPEMVGSDVGEFNDALERGDPEGAVEKYRGKFLDGFHLSDAPEFEQWLATERNHLERSYSVALERLAQRAEAANDYNAAVGWWRRLTDTDPVGSKNAIGLIGALVNAGDHAAALQHAERYEAVVAQELGTSVGPAVANLVAEVRAKAKTSPLWALKSQPRGAPSSVSAPSPVSAPYANRWARRRPAPYLLGGLVALLLIATVLLLRGTIGGGKSPTPAAPSIAVLPFANLSGDQRDAALVDGVSEELIAALAKIRNLRVIARTSAFAFRDSHAGARLIADSLGVSNILEGGVQRLGSRLRVQVRLIDGRDGSTRWAETYNRELKDIFWVQSDIAGSVARELTLRLSESTIRRIRRGSTPSIAAYELYLRGNDPALIRSDSGAHAALEYFRQAIALDPGYAAAYAGLARIHLRIGRGDDSALSRRDRLALAEQAALKALALDDSLGEAHAALSFVKRSNYDFPSAEAELKRAVALEPANGRIREWLVHLYVLTDRPEQALVEARRALELDPLSPEANVEIAHALIANGRCDEALAQLAKLRSLRPRLLRVNAYAAQCYARKEKWPAAIAEMESISTVGGPRAQAFLGYLLARSARTAEARRILTKMIDRSKRIRGGAFEVAAVYAGLGDTDEAFRWLDRAVDDRSFGLDHVEPVLDGLRSDPRFDRFRERLGIQKR